MTMNSTSNRLVPANPKSNMTGEPAKSKPTPTSVPNNAIQAQTKPGTDASTSSEVGAHAAARNFAQGEKKRKQDSSVANRSLRRRAENKSQINDLSSQLGITDSVESRANEIASLVTAGADLLRWVEDKRYGGEEPAETWLSLKAASHIIKDEKGKEKLEDVTTEFVHECNVEIKTSLNVAETVSKAYPDNESAQKMRKIIGQGNQNTFCTRSIFRALLGNFDVDSFGKSLDVYTRSLAKDLSHAMPSTDISYLSDALTHLKSANGARSLVLDCQDFLRSLDKGGIS